MARKSDRWFMERVSCLFFCGFFCESSTFSMLFVEFTRRILVLAKIIENPSSM